VDFNAIWARVQRAVRREPGVFGEIGADPKATGEAIAVAVAASLISGLGAIWPGGARFGFVGWIIGAAIGSVIGLGIGTAILYVISRFFRAQGEFINLFRGLGYATAPQALGIIPFVGGIVGAIWSLLLAIRAVKETQNTTEGTAVAIVLIPVAIGLLLGLLLAFAALVAFFGFEAANN
jgi:hypothetical protein